MSYLNQQKIVEAENEERERRKVEDELALKNEEAQALSPVNNERFVENSVYFENSTRQIAYSHAANECEQVSNSNPILFSQRIQFRKVI